MIFANSEVRISPKAGRFAKLSDLSGTVQISPQTESGPRDDSLNIGDFVAVTLDRQNIFLAEVIACEQPARPITRVRVRFLDTPPYAEILEDEISSEFVQRVTRLQDLVDGVRNQPLLADAPLEEIVESCRSAMVTAWNLGLHKMLLAGIN